MQNIIERLNLLVQLTPQDINSKELTGKFFFDSAVFCSIIADIAETSLNLLQFFSPVNEIIPLDDHCFDNSLLIGISLAEMKPNDNNLSQLLRGALTYFNETMIQAIASSSHSDIDFACLQLFFSQISAKVEQGFLEKTHAMLLYSKNLSTASAFPPKLSYSYVCSIIQKLGHIPMAEINFKKKLLHSNLNMASLFDQQAIEVDKLIPDSFFDKKCFAEFAKKAIPEPFFRHLNFKDRTFQQLILVLPQNHVFVTFLVEAHETTRRTESFNDSVSQQNHQNEQFNKIRESFLANMSHELRTPLHEIIGFADLLFEQFDGRLNDAQIEYVQMIQRGGERLLELINYLLEIGESVGAKDSTTTFPVNALIDEVLRRLANELQSKEIDCQVKVESALITYKGDKERLIIVIFEIMSYILKYVRKNGKLKVAFNSDTEWNVFKITAIDAALTNFSEEMLLSHATFFLDLMQGQLKSEITSNNDRIFEIRLPR